MKPRSSSSPTVPGVQVRLRQLQGQKPELRTSRCCRRRLKLRLRTARTTTGTQRSPDLLRTSREQVCSAAESAAGRSGSAGFYSDTLELTCRRRSLSVAFVASDLRPPTVWSFTCRLTWAPRGGGRGRRARSQRARAERDRFTGAHIATQTPKSTRARKRTPATTVARHFYRCGGRGSTGVAPAGETRNSRGRLQHPESSFSSVRFYNLQTKWFRCRLFPPDWSSVWWHHSDITKTKEVHRFNLSLILFCYWIIPTFNFTWKNQIEELRQSVKIWFQEFSQSHNITWINY